MDAQVGRRFGRRVTPPERRLQRLQVHFTVFSAHFKLALERNKRALVRRGAHTPQTKFLHAEPGAYFTANLSYWPGGVGLTHRFPTNRSSVQLRQAPPFGYCCRASSNTQLSTVVASEAVEITLHFYKNLQDQQFYTWLCQGNTVDGFKAGGTRTHEFPSKRGRESDPIYFYCTSTKRWPV